MNLTSREKVLVHWGLTKSFWGKLERPPPPPPPHTHTLDRTQSSQPLSVFLVKIFSIFGSLSVILAHSLFFIAHAQPQASPAPMQIIDFVRAKVAAGGELGAKVACRVPLKIDQWLLSRWDRSPYDRAHFRTRLFQ